MGRTEKNGSGSRASDILTVSPAELENVLVMEVDGVLSRGDLVERITNYFAGCVETTIDDNGNEITRWRTPPTKTGLALALGFASRDGLADAVNGVCSNGRPYSNKENARRLISNADLYIVRRALLFIEGYYEGALTTNGKNPTGAIFWLLNSQSKTWTNEHININVSRQEGRRTPDEIAATHGVTIEQREKMANALPPADFLDGNGFSNDMED